MVTSTSKLKLLGFIITMLFTIPLMADDPDVSGAQKDATSPGKDLSATYQAFGKKEGIKNIVDDLMENLLADPRTRPHFEPVNHDNVKRLLVEQFCQILDGPCEYTGRSMKNSHAHMDINEAHFNALVESLQDAMDKHNVPFRHQNKLLAELAPMHKDIITE